MILAAVVFVFLGASSANAQVYRCGNEYRHAPCAGGAVVDVSPAVSDPEGAKTIVLNLCAVPGSDRTWWIKDRCAARGWSLLRTARVPADMSWEGQLEVARGQHRAARALSVPPPVVHRPGPVGPTKKQQCTSLEEWIAELDRMGRAGSRYYDLEWVRSQRKEARDKQFRMRC